MGQKFGIERDPLLHLDHRQLDCNRCRCGLEGPIRTPPVSQAGRVFFSLVQCSRLPTSRQHMYKYCGTYGVFEPLNRWGPQPSAGVARCEYAMPPLPRGSRMLDARTLDKKGPGPGSINGPGPRSQVPGPRSKVQPQHSKLPTVHVQEVQGDC